MSVLGDVPPLSEARKRRIEARLFAALDESLPAAERPAQRRPSGVRHLPVVGALALAAAAAGVVGLRSRYAAPPSALEPATTRLVTAANGSHLIVGTAGIEVGPESTVVVTGNDDQGILVLLEDGAVDCDVSPRAGRPPMLVQAGDITVRVVGTRFHVDRDGAAVHVAVDHGTVEVVAPTARSFVHDGERWTNALAPTSVPEAGSTAPAEPPLPAELSPRTLGTSGPQPVAAGAKPAAPRESPLSPKERFFEASRLEPGDPNRALALYGELAASGDAWAANALFAQGRLESELGRSTEARRSLETYLRLHPDGPNAEDARHLLARLR